MTIASAHYARTGKTVAETCRELHAQGKGIEYASTIIGYRTSTDMRKWFARRRAECPWPLDLRASAIRHPIPDETLSLFIELRRAMPAEQAAAIVGHPNDSLRSAVLRRRPDLIAA